MFTQTNGGSGVIIGSGDFQVDGIRKKEWTN